MRNILGALLLVASTLPLFSQSYQKATDSIPEYRLPYKIWVSQYGQPEQRMGIYNTTDSSIIFLKTPNWFSVKTPKEEISVKDITIIKYRKKNQIGRRMGYGVLIGFTVGAILGAVSYEPCDEPGWGCFLAPQSRAGAAVLFGSAGATVGFWGGLISGSLRTTIPIYGNTNNYKAQRERLSKLGVEQN